MRLYRYMEKKCTRCLETKVFGEFYKKRGDGTKAYDFFARCKACEKAIYADKRDVDRHAFSQRLRERYLSNRERLLAEAKERYKNEDPVKKKERSKAKHKKEWAAKKHIITEKKKRRRITHREEVRVVDRRRYERRFANLQQRLASNLRCRLYFFIKGQRKNGSAVRLLGCSLEELRAHLESQFEPGMSWDNYGKGDNDWSIDHVMPMSVFDLTDKQHLALANHYLNLRPMWHLQNISKGNKLPDEFRRFSCEVWGTPAYSA